MQQAFVLLTCDENLADAVIEEIRSIPTVSQVDRVQGMYDILVRLNATKEIMKETIRTKLRYVEGVRSVLTLFEYENLR